MTNKKIIARQIAPEYQQAPEIDAENVYIFGNRDYNGVNTDAIREIQDGLEIISETFDELQSGAHWGGYADMREVIRFNLPQKNNGEPYTRTERLRLIRAADIYVQAPSRTASGALDAVCVALGIIHGQPYEWHTLRGRRQSEWQYIILPEAYADAREFYEIEYFNLGTEWLVNDDFSVYVYENPREEIASAIGCKPEDLQLLAFDGYEQIPKYKELEA